MLGCEPEAPLKQPPSPGPAGASLLCPEAVASSRAAHQSPSCPTTLARHTEGGAGKMGRQGQAPHGAGARESGAFLL